MSTNPWIVHVKKVQAETGLSYKEAMKEAKKSYKSQKGEGIKEVVGAAKSRALTFLHSRPKDIDALFKQNPLIRHVEVCRKPIQSYVKKAIQLMTGNQLTNLQNRYSYDDIYHLFMIMTFADGSQLATEKNEIPHLFKPPKRTPSTECKSVGVNARYADVIKGAEAANPSLYRYTAEKYNCQNFISTLVHQMGANLDDFILQNVGEALGTRTKKTAVTVTDVAAFLKRLKS